MSSEGAASAELVAAQLPPLVEGGVSEVEVVEAAVPVVDDPSVDVVSVVWAQGGKSMRHLL